MNMVAFNHIRAAARSLAASTDVTLHVGDLSAHLTRRASPLVSHQGVEFTAAPGDGSRALRAENARFREALKEVVRLMACAPWHNPCNCVRCVASRALGSE